MDELVGVWGAELIVGPEVRGELTVVREGSRWRAGIAGLEAFDTSGGRVPRFVFPGDSGEFRGRWADSSRIAGHWVQPPRLTNGTAYATPVELKAHALGVWRGQVAPLDDRLAVYLTMRRQPEGQEDLTAFIRDPERNSGLRLGLEEVRLEGDQVRISGSRGEIVAGYDEANVTLTLRPPGYGETLDLTPRGPDEAPGFY